MRFPVASLAALMIGASGPAYAQSAPTPAASAPVVRPSQPLPARIDDIQVAREGETISILVKLSQQPAAAAAKSSGETLSVEIDGVALSPLALATPAGSLVTRVEASNKTLTLSGAAFASATTVIYRNAVLIEAKLAEPTLKSGSSLMSGTPVAAAKPAVSPVPPAVTAAPHVTEPPAAPLAAPTPQPKPSEPSTGGLESHPAPISLLPGAKPAGPTATLAGIDAARCTTAEGELKKDPWALVAMGDHALCLLDTDKIEEARNRLDQLAAITPLDWRVALGRAILDSRNGDVAKADEGYRAAAKAAPSDGVRSAISKKISAPVALNLLEAPAPR